MGAGGAPAEEEKREVGAGAGAEAEEVEGDMLVVCLEEEEKIDERQRALVLLVNMDRRCCMAAPLLPRREDERDNIVRIFVTIQNC